MRVTKSHIKQLIKEEIRTILQEQRRFDPTQPLPPASMEGLEAKILAMHKDLEVVFNSVHDVRKDLERGFGKVLSQIRNSR
jgi:hypothetical protein